MNLRHEGYWDEHYEQELRNFDDNGDEGDIWFGKGLNRRIVERLLDIINAEHDDLSFKMIDIGCGNAFLLCSLVEKLIMNHGELGSKELEILGIDYSKNSIDLSHRIIQHRGLAGNIKLKQCDFLDTNQVKEVTGGLKYDFIVDKGTFDAICLLSGDRLEETKINYINSLYSIAKSRTIFILASCNHTEDELLALFSITGGTAKELSHRLVSRIDMPYFKFGGEEGTQVCCLVIAFE